MHCYPEYKALYCPPYRTNLMGHSLSDLSLFKYSKILQVVIQIPEASRIPGCLVSEA